MYHARHLKPQHTGLLVAVTAASLALVTALSLLMLHSGRKQGGPVAQAPRQQGTPTAGATLRQPGPSEASSATAHPGGIEAGVAGSTGSVRGVRGVRQVGTPPVRLGGAPAAAPRLGSPSAAVPLGADG
ncbi:MAG: hypothetical protein ACTHOK_11035, partial [Nocardioidaceae bacterium]